MTEDARPADPAEPDGRSGSQGLEELKGAVETLRRRAEANSLQIDEMQIAASRDHRRRRAWYRDMSTLIAALALVASVASVALTYSNGNADRAERDRTRLSGIISELSDITTEYSDSVRQSGAQAAPFTQSVGQRAALCTEAYEIILRSGSSPDQEITVAEFSIPAGQQEKAKEIAQRVLDSRSNPGATVRGLRIIGTVQFQSMDLNAGRSTYDRAAHVYDASQYSSTSALDKAAYNSYTEIDWAGLEWGAHQCAEARTHLARAISILQGVGNPIGQTKDQIDALGPGINACV